MSSPASAALPTVRLVPLAGPVPELLQSGFPHRPVLVLDGSRDESMIIGRGSRTGIRDPSVMRKIFRLSWDDDGTSSSNNTHQQVSAIRIAQDTSKIFINGLPWEESQPKLHLGHGDTLSLNCENYGYKVEIISSVGSAGGSPEKKRKTDLPDEDAVNTSEGAVASSSISIPATAATSLSEEIQCSVCLEIQVNPRAAVPCGHSSCGSCISKLQQCPQCRARIKSHVPNVQLESLISTLASVPNLLDADDVEHYNERKSVNPTTDNKEPNSRSNRRTPRRHLTPSSPVLTSQPGVRRAFVARRTPRGQTTASVPTLGNGAVGTLLSASVASNNGQGSNSTATADVIVID